MILTYNDIDFAVEQILRFEQVPEYSEDGVDFLYNHVTLTVRAIFNPKAMSDNGKTAAESIRRMREALMVPRKQVWLRMPSGGQADHKTLLLSPLEDEFGDAFPCDARFGPRVVGVPVVTVIGEKTAVVDFTVETWINERDTMRPILSHRWEMTNEIDQDFYTTRTINGEAIFRGDWLQSNEGSSNETPVTPDDFRPYLLHPVPDNFQRKSVRVTVSSDNTRLRYTVIDVEQPANISSNYRRITSIEGACTVATGKREMSAERLIMVGIAGVVSAMTPTSAGGAMPSLQQLVNIVTMPKLRISLYLRVRGTREATQEDLANALQHVLVNYNFPSNAGNAISIFDTVDPQSFFCDLAITYNMFQRQMEAQTTGEFGLGSIAIQEVFRIGPLAEAFDRTVLDPVTSTTSGPTANPPYGGGSFGTWIERCVAQALGNPENSPQQVPQGTENLSNLNFLTPE